MKMDYVKIKKIWRGVEAVLLFLLLIFGLLIFIPMLPIDNNYRIFAVTSGSMETAVKTGSVVISQPRGIYNEGEIITFEKYASGQTEKMFVTHRILAKDKVDGIAYYQTKGDANDVADPEKISETAVIGKSLFSIPYVGYMYSFVKTLPGLIIFILIPSMIIVFEELDNIKKELHKVLSDKDKE